MYYHLGPNRETIGPVSLDRLRELVSEGSLAPDDVVWAEGWADWQAARFVDGLFSVDAPATSSAVGVGPAAAGAVMPPVQPGVMTKQSNSPWAIPAMAPAGYKPSTFKLLYGWYLATSLLSLLGILIAGTVMGIGFSLGPRDGEAMVIIGTIVLGLASLLSIAPAVLFYVLLFKMWRQIQDGHAQSGPGKAVGFMFIPCFQYYWVFVAFHGLANDLNAYAERYGMRVRRASPGIAMATAIMLIATAVPYVGLLFLVVLIPLWLVMSHQMANASRDIAVALAERGGVPA